jgi:predicted enzyme related to lactoylglutathione lyase
MPPDGAEKPSVFRDGGVSYLRIPAPDPARVAAFYAAVFGWAVRGDREDPSFEDGSGHVIGHFRADLPVAGDAGICPYIYVAHLKDTLEQVIAHGGEVATAAYPEGDLLVARFRDPAGNVVGAWEHAPRG